MKTNAFTFKKILELGRNIYRGNSINAGWLKERGIESEEQLLQLVAREEEESAPQAQRDARIAKEKEAKAAREAEAAEAKALNQMLHARDCDNKLQLAEATK